MTEDVFYNRVKNEPDVHKKREILMDLYCKNPKKFYQEYSSHFVEWTPLIYDPGIAYAIEHNRGEFLINEKALVLTLQESSDPSAVEMKIRYATERRKIRLAVITDGEAILGIGDWGYNGGEIAVGKSIVYAAAAGINPKYILPIMIDCGTDNEELLSDHFYGGQHVHRERGKAYEAGVRNILMTLIKLCGPYIHFEDFGREHASSLLKDTRDYYGRCFNDDIEGTGIVALGAILKGMKIKKEKLTDQVYLCFGAGSAGCGIAKQVYAEMIKEGLSAKEARSRIYLMDKGGLVYEDDEDITPAQKELSVPEKQYKELRGKSLEEVIAVLHPTILAGTSTVHNAFTKKCVEEMCSYCARPLILPLSNPTEKIEADPHDLLNWSKGKALIATGIPCGTIDYQGKNIRIAQANNFLAYPGLGLGVMSARLTSVNDEVLREVSYALADYPADDECLLPDVKDIHSISDKIAHEVIGYALKHQMNQEKDPLARMKEITAKDN